MGKMGRRNHRCGTLVLLVLDDDGFSLVVPAGKLSKGSMVEEGFAFDVCGSGPQYKASRARTAIRGLDFKKYMTNAM